MTKEEVKKIVIKHLKDNINKLENVEIDTNKSLKELGAKSLDIVEIVSASMRELKIRVPRVELAGLKNLDALIELFVAKLENNG